MLAQMCSAIESASSGWSSATSRRSATVLGPGLRAVDEHRELVAADPGEPARVAHRLLEPPRHPLDDDVAELVAERVVDRLEVVDVEQHHRHRAPIVRGAVQGLLERLGQRGAIRQSGQRVVMRRDGSRCAACRPPKYTASIGTKHTGTSATLALAEASSAGAKASTQPAVQAWKARSSRR